MISGGWLFGHSVINGMKFKLNLKGRNRPDKQKRGDKSRRIHAGENIEDE